MGFVAYTVYPGIRAKTPNRPSNKVISDFTFFFVYLHFIRNWNKTVKFAHVILRNNWSTSS